ncbi:DUF6236 family protein [Kitasatospora azatica]|uniref:DUF6236 family protein n=1 Tax=Kitasatospora azatica TaxID=58347 RepID=UPI0012F8F0D3|nr:DUF6236 family protein [Kitasatospora azatica]
MQRIGLYYPYVHFRDEEWIKAAALYWPRLARVVPPGFPISDPRLIKVLRSELDFVVDVDPREAAEAVAPAFLKVVEDHGVELERRFPARSYARELLNSYAPTTTGSYVPVAAGEPSNDEDHLARPPHLRLLVGLHRHEVDPRLRDALMDAGLAVETPSSDLSSSPFVRWFATDPIVAWVYKCALTEELARRTRFTPTTDQVAAHTAAEVWDVDRITAALLGQPPRPAEPDSAARLGLMAVQCVLPDGLRTVPVEKIIRLRRDYHAEFNAFTAAAERAAEDLREQTAGIEDRHAFEQYLRLKFEESLALPLEDLRKAMSGLNLRTFYSAVNYKFELPALVGAASGWAGNVPVALGSIAVAGATLRQATTEARSAKLADSPVGYLLRVERDLKPATLVSRVARTLARAAGTGI